MAAAPCGSGQDASSREGVDSAAISPMNDYQLGANLRRQILADLQRGQSSDGRRLQALVGDFCGESQSNLLPALKYLVLTPAFSHAVGQTPALGADARLQLRLNQELQELFAPAICERMAAVVSGLLNLGEGSTATATATASAALAPSTGSSRGLVAVLSFIAGVLVVGVVGGLVWLLLLSRQQQALAPPSGGAPLQEAPAEAERKQPSESPMPPPAPDLEQPLDPAAVDQAIATVQQLYSALSSRNSEAARQLFGAAAADQFDASFFEQFERVSVADLRETSRTGSTVNLQGVVTFLYPDGSSQSETRSFSVDTGASPAVITASAFGQVVKPRN